MVSGGVLQDSDLEKINLATLNILERVGLKVEHEQVRGRLLAAGAGPGASSGTVRFPREMIAEYLALAPESVKLCGMGKRQIGFEGHSW